MQVDSSCSCGATQDTAEVDPKRIVLSHCSDCQTNAGTNKPREALRTLPKSDTQL